MQYEIPHKVLKGRRVLLVKESRRLFHLFSHTELCQANIHLNG